MLKAQETHFSQYYASSAYLNPSLVGIDDGIKANWNYRNQWPEIKNSFITHSISLDNQFTSNKAGIGINVLNDRAGDGTLSITSLGGVYAHSIKLNRKLFLRAGMKFSYVQKDVDWSELVFEDMIDSRNGVTHSTQQRMGSNLSFLDLSAGFFIYNDIYFGGIAVDHLSEPGGGLVNENGNSKLLRKYTMHGGAKFQVNHSKHYSVSPNILISRQGNFNKMNVGLYFETAALIIGTWYSNDEAMILLLGLKGKSFKIGYSYDIHTSAMTGSSLGSHEISYTQQFGKRKKTKRYKTITCPAF